MRKTDPNVVATPTIQVIERMFSLIDVLASREEAISLKEISEKTGLHPSTAHRILNDLATGRFVDRPEAGNYRLGMRLLELGNLVKGRLNVRDAALAPMRELHKLIQQPVNLSMRQGDEIVYIERAYSERSGMQVVRAIGGRAPLHLTSTGKLFLAVDDPQRVRAYATRTGLAGHTKNSITQLPVLERSWRRPGNTALRGTTKSWSWACAAWPPASMTTRTSSWRACPFPPRPTGWTTAGCPSCRPPRVKFQPRWATKHERASGARCRQPLTWRISVLAGSEGIDSTQRRTRSASPRRLSLPAESRNTMMSLRPAILACMTRHWPASEM
jgi:DNA-binding IclR family transcriptional regulator